MIFDLFDTFKFLERLEKAGATRELAAALVDIQRETIADAMDSTLATKTDVNTLQTDIREMELRLKGEMREMELRMTIKLGGMIAASIAVTAALVKLL